MAAVQGIVAKSIIVMSNIIIVLFKQKELRAENPYVQSSKLSYNNIISNTEQSKLYYDITII